MRFFSPFLAFLSVAWLAQASKGTMAEILDVSDELLVPPHGNVFDSNDGQSLGFNGDVTIGSDRELSTIDCAAECSNYSRPVIAVSGAAFKTLVSNCIAGIDCPYSDVPMNCWNTSAVTDMNKAFRFERTFNEPLHCWDTSRVTTFFSMFVETEAFDQPIGSWNTGNLQNLECMFCWKTKFNQPIGQWDTSKVTSMNGVIAQNFYFNQPLDSWNVQKVTKFDNFAWNSVKFNQCLGTWPSQVSSSANTLNMFRDTGCPIKSTSLLDGSTWCQDTSHGCFAPVEFSTHKVVRAKVQNKTADVTTLEPFVAKTFFEAKDNSDIVMELYVNVPPGEPCNNGTALNTSLYEAAVTEIGTTDFQTTIYAAEYMIANVKSTEAYKAETNTAGEVAVCARVAKKLDFDSTTSGAEYLSVVDTVFKVKVDSQAKFQNFTETVSIIDDSGDEIFEGSIVKIVDVDAFLCAYGKPAKSAYKMGDEFGVCVRPSKKYIGEGYSVTGFVNVVCSNSGATRTLFRDSTAEALTRLISDASITALDKNGTEAGSGAAGFVSLVTAGYFSKGESTFSCSGDLSLSESSSRRRLTRRFAFSSDDIDEKRLLQEVGNTSPFSSTVALDTETGAELFVAGASLVGGVAALLLSVVLATI